MFWDVVAQPICKKEQRIFQLKNVVKKKMLKDDILYILYKFIKYVKHKNQKKTVNTGIPNVFINNY